MSQPQPHLTVSFLRPHSWDLPRQFGSPKKQVLRCIRHEEIGGEAGSKNKGAEVGRENFQTAMQVQASLLQKETGKEGLGRKTLRPQRSSESVLARLMESSQEKAGVRRALHQEGMAQLKYTLYAVIVWEHGLGVSAVWLHGQAAGSCQSAATHSSSC